MRIRHKRRRQDETPELDVTPFMNLMIVLVPVLLLSMVFTHTTVIELDFPAADSVAANEPDEQEKLHLEVQILESALVVSDGRSIIRHFPQVEGAHDFAGLTELMQEIKARYPAKRDVLILLNADTDYQTLVTVMDRVRNAPVEQGDAAGNGNEAVLAELFPVVSLGDAPEEDS